MEKERTILHCDMNCFYASCEMAYHPELQGKPLLFRATVQAQPANDAGKRYSGGSLPTIQEELQMERAPPLGRCSCD